jgi:hypothetical protein
LCGKIVFYPLLLVLFTLVLSLLMAGFQLCVALKKT